MCCKSGFTLLELMIVVAIIGILASVAIPGFSKYMRDSKKSEATSLLRSVADGATIYFNEEHTFDQIGLDVRKEFFPGCEDSGEPQACSDVSMYDGERILGQRISPEDPNIKLKQVPWTRLNFTINKPFLYEIQYSSTPVPGDSQFTARAVASLETADDSIIEIYGSSKPKMSISNIIVIKDGDIETP